LRRLLWIALGLVLVGAGLVAVLRGGGRGNGPPLDAIDAGSRARLEHVLLEEARREPPEAPR
jgi:hypothetical protein